MFDVYNRNNNEDDIREFLGDKTLLGSDLEHVARDVITKAGEAMRNKDFSPDSMKVIVLVSAMQQLTDIGLPASKYLEEKGLAEDHALGMEDLKAWIDRNLELRSKHARDEASTTTAQTESMSGDDSEKEVKDSWILVPEYRSGKSA
jgi:hypothetical protein